MLFISTPGIGHVFPMVPLAWALRAAGPEVLVGTNGYAMAVERAGRAPSLPDGHTGVIDWVDDHDEYETGGREVRCCAAWL